MKIAYKVYFDASYSNDGVNSIERYVSMLRKRMRDITGNNTCTSKYKIRQKYLPIRCVTGHVSSISDIMRNIQFKDNDIIQELFAFLWDISEIEDTKRIYVMSTPTVTCDQDITVTFMAQCYNEDLDTLSPVFMRHNTKFRSILYDERYSKKLIMKSMSINNRVHMPTTKDDLYYKIYIHGDDIEAEKYGISSCMKGIFHHNIKCTKRQYTTSVYTDLENMEVISGRCNSSFSKLDVSFHKKEKIWNKSVCKDLDNILRIISDASDIILNDRKKVIYENFHNEDTGVRYYIFISTYTQSEIYKGRNPYNEFICTCMREIINRDSLTENFIFYMPDKKLESQKEYFDRYMKKDRKYNKSSEIRFL